MRMYDIISHKRDNKELSEKEIKYFINGCTDGSIPDYQISALLMAIYLNGMSERETVNLTLAMANSGHKTDLSLINGITVDKHSTGGVGDKTTLIVVPIVAAFGVKVAKMSGKGLGHTGGTIDKLESIEGFRTELTPNEFISCINSVGASIISQSGNLAPADKKLYALRDVTATVNSIPLIASSIMSKKLACGSKCIVLDVKTGNGAFMKTPDQAEMLAREMVKIGKATGRKTSALITNMNIPLGNAVGNSLEVIEAIDILRGNSAGELYNICVELAAEMISLTNGININECKKLAEATIRTGTALNKFKEIIAAQGGNPALVDNPSLFKRAEFSLQISSKQSGYIKEMDSEKIGTAAMILGAGRLTKNDSIDHSAGIILSKKTGDFVDSGDIIATLYTNNRSKLSDASEMFNSALKLSDKKPEQEPLIYKTIRGE